NAVLGSSDANPPILHNWEPEKAIAEMDKHGIATSIVSMGNPGVWFGPAEAKEARALTRSSNEYMAGMARDFPGRFGWFAACPLPDRDGSLEAIAYAYDKLKADGVGLLTSYDDKYPGDPMFWPVMEELNKRKAVVFIHPTTANCCRGLQPGIPASALEFPFD